MVLHQLWRRGRICVQQLLFCHWGKNTRSGFSVILLPIFSGDIKPYAICRDSALGVLVEHVHNGRCHCWQNSSPQGFVDRVLWLLLVKSLRIGALEVKPPICQLHVAVEELCQTDMLMAAGRKDSWLQFSTTEGACVKWKQICTLVKSMSHAVSSSGCIAMNRPGQLRPTQTTLLQKHFPL